MKTNQKEVESLLFKNQDLTPEMIARVVRAMRAMMTEEETAQPLPPVHESPGRYSEIAARGEKKVVAARLGITPRGLDMRIQRGWDPERALTTPKSPSQIPQRPAEEEVRLSPSQSFALLKLAAADIRIAEFDHVHDQHVWGRLLDKLVDLGFALRHKGNHYAVSRRGAWAAEKIAPPSIPVRHESSTGIRRIG